MGLPSLVTGRSGSLSLNGQSLRRRAILKTTGVLGLEIGSRG